jgi:hypothetical protein
MSKKILFGLIILISLGISIIFGVITYGVLNIQGRVACTMEAKLCPDGSSVGRTGPNCEFAQCPVSLPDPTAGWQTYNNVQYGFEFKFPQSFGGRPTGRPKPPWCLPVET